MKKIDAREREMLIHLIDPQMSQIFENLEKMLKDGLDLKKVGRNMVIMCALRDMTGADLSRKTNIDSAIISRLMTGTKLTNAYYLIRTAQALEVQIRTLLEADLERVLLDEIIRFEKE